MHLWLVAFLTVVSLCVVRSTLAYPEKHLAGPPSEFNIHHVPQPQNVITKEKSTSEYIWFQPQKNTQEVYRLMFPVDGPEEFVFSFSSPYNSELNLVLYDPSGNLVPLSPIHSSMPIGENKKIPTDVYIIQNSVEGTYVLVITSMMDYDRVSKISTTSYPNAVLTIINNDNLEIESHYSSYLIKKGQSIGIVSQIVDVVTRSVPENIAISSALLEVITPVGEDLEVAMTDSDDTLKPFNIPPSSGVYGAHVVASLPGEYLLQAKIQGTVQDPQTNTVRSFYRSSQHVIQVSPSDIELTGSASLNTLSSGLLSVDIGVSVTTQTQLRAYTEVWGTNAQNELVPVCWLGGVVMLSGDHISLELNPKWLQLAGVTGSLILRGTYLNDLDTSFPVAISSTDIPVADSQDLVSPSAFDLGMEITKEMREGVNPLKEYFQNLKSQNTGAPSLVLLPGYCSEDNPWSTSTKFTNGAYFNSGGGNIGNHDFASKVMDYVKQLQLPSFSLIGHSQGGMVAAHIHNYFFTGLETATGGRLIQTVGTPWKGCSAAGGLADLGDVFGIACGSNNDLSLDGAVNWLAGITSETRKDIYFYTTTYELGNFFGDYCNVAMNLVLEWPNDGTTEIDYAILDGANYAGNTEKWCHTSSMAYPAQYTDETRNDEMNTLAAR